MVLFYLVDAAAGSVTTDVFEAQFFTVPSVALYSTRDMDDICRLSASVIGDRNADWEKRIDAVLRRKDYVIILEKYDYLTYFLNYFS